jgi:transposase-like protein
MNIHCTTDKIQEQEMTGKRKYVLWQLKKSANEKTAMRDAYREDKIVTCKLCGSTNVVKYGYFKDTQLRWCKECNRKFTDNKAAPGMKVPVNQIARALDMYYEGVGLKNILRYLEERYYCYVSDSTLYEWIGKFTNKAISAARYDKPIIADIWVAIETPAEVGDQKIWFWDIIDIKTRFLVASHVSTKLTVNDASQILAQAVRKGGRLPRVIVADHLAIYFDGKEMNYCGETKQITVKRVHTAAATRLLEHFRSRLEARTIIVKRYRNIRRARTVIEGWPVYYNYLRPREVENTDTPAMKACLNSGLKVKLP